MLCEICGRELSNKGFARYSHGMAHVRRGEAESYLQFCNREPRTGFEIQHSTWAFRSIMKPLNGTKTHPLSAFALGVLRQIVESPLPTSGINPGVINRLLREGLVEIASLPSPFKKHKGGTCDHLRVTEKGRDRVAS